MIGPLENVLSRFSNVKSSNDGWIARCPAHDDQRNSLKISMGKDDKILLFCHAGCSFKAIVAALGMEEKDLFPQDNGNGGNGNKKLVKTYDYTDAAGKLVYQVCRYQPKQFIQRRPDGKGDWIYNLRGITPLVYRLPQVIAGIRDGRHIVIVEGEKDVEAMERLGFVATCNSGGAGKFPSGMVKHFTGAKVCIIPDHDEPGRKHSQQVAGMLHGTASEIRIVELPGLREKGDVSDWIESGGAREQLIELVKSAPAWKPSQDACNSPEPKFNLTDLGDSQRLVSKYGADIRYNHTPTGLFYLWNGKTWAQDQKNLIHNYAVLTARDILRVAADCDSLEMREALREHSKKMESLSKQKSIIGMLQTLPEIQIGYEEFDAKPMLFNCDNGTLELESGDIVFREHRREDYLTICAPVRYDPAATCPRWVEFLNRIFSADAEMIQFVQQATSLCLSGLTSEQAFYFCHGVGANGKSLFFNVLEMLFGSDYFHKGPVEMILQQRQAQPTHDLASLPGKRMVVFSEIPEGRRLNESLMKDLCGGDSVSACRKYEHPFIFQPTAKIFLYGNHEPAISGTDEGIWRRVRKIPFSVTIPVSERKPMQQMLSLFKAELSGILNWLLAGYQAYQEKGLIEAGAVRAATQQYRDDSDIIGQFIEERCENGLMVQGKALYEGYKAWCNEGNERVIPRKSFLHKLKERGYCTKEGHGRSTIVTGITLIQYP